MAPVLAQMSRNSVSAGILGDPSRAQRIGMIPTACIPDRRDVIDIYAKTKVTTGHVCELLF